MQKMIDVLALYFLIFLKIYIFILERAGEGQRKRGRENLKQEPHRPGT